MKRLIFVFAILLFAACERKTTSEVFLSNEGAVNGYDVVAYFTDSAAVKGSKEFIYRWNDADWFFASSQHRDMFKENPERYAPQFGGYCAYGASEGYKAQTAPDAWTIVDGKLYLNYNDEVRTLWLQDTARRIPNAHKNWTEVRKQEF
jgi:YHS domain-containing protein